MPGLTMEKANALAVAIYLDVPLMFKGVTQKSFDNLFLDQRVMIISKRLGFTDREGQLMTLIMGGLSEEQSSEVLEVSRPRISQLVSQIKHRLRVDNKSQLIVKFLLMSGLMI